MKITLEAEIYDDPEYCERWLNEQKTKREKCSHVNWCNCGQFRTYDGQPTSLRFDLKSKRTIKCGECKKAYARDKKKQTEYIHIVTDGRSILRTYWKNLNS